MCSRLRAGPKFHAHEFYSNHKKSLPKFTAIRSAISPGVLDFISEFDATLYKILNHVNTVAHCICIRIQLFFTLSKQWHRTEFSPKLFYIILSLPDHYSTPFRSSVD